MKLLSTSLLIIGVVEVFCKIPNYINICKKDDTLPQCLLNNYNTVVKHLTENGEPMFKLGSLNSIHLDKLPLSAGDLTITLIHPVFTGVETTTFSEFTMNDKEIHMKGVIPRVEYTGDYIVDGKILILPIKGEGKTNISHVGLQFEYTSELKIEERKGKKYYYVDSNWDDTKLSLKAKKSHFRLDNLFGGDPRLGPQMNEFLNENQADVFEEVKPAIKDGLAFYIMHPYINGFLRHIPIDNLFQK